jgi:hypothetical protein
MCHPEHAESAVTMNIYISAWVIPCKTHAAHATGCPFNQIDPLVSTRKPETSPVDDHHDEIRTHGFHCDLAIRWGFAVQFQLKRNSTGEIVRLACGKAQKLKLYTSPHCVTAVREGEKMSTLKEKDGEY